MEQKKRILVLGVTGAQGRSVAKALLSDNHFEVRIFTRNPESVRAQELKESGAEIAEGSTDDMGSLMRAMKDCYGVFGGTNFREYNDLEYQRGKNLVDAVQLSGISHFVFHILSDYEQLNAGKFSSPHEEIKAALLKYSRSLNIPTTFVHMGFYYENFQSYFPFQKEADGVYYFGFQQDDTCLAMASVKDLGCVVRSVFNHPAEYIGRKIAVIAANETGTRYAELMSKVLNQDIRYKNIPAGGFTVKEMQRTEELNNLFESQRLNIPNRLINLIESYGLNPDMQSFEHWLRKNKSGFEAHLNALSPKKAA